MSGYRRQQRHPTPRGVSQPTKATPPKPRNPHHTPPRGSNPTPRPLPPKGHTPPAISTRLHVNPRAICCFCGQQGHGEQERTAIRRIHCPAYGTTCSACGRSNHSPHMCWQNMAENESAVSEELDRRPTSSILGLHLTEMDPTQVTTTTAH